MTLEAASSMQVIYGESEQPFPVRTDFGCSILLRNPGSGSPLSRGDLLLHISHSISPLDNGDQLVATMFIVNAKIRWHHSFSGFLSRMENQYLSYFSDRYLQIVQFSKCKNIGSCTVHWNFYVNRAGPFMPKSSCTVTGTSCTVTTDM